MATIYSLHRSITEMSPQEAYDLIYKIRSNRRIKPVKKVKEKKVCVTKAKTSKAKTLTADAKINLLKQLGLI